MQKLNLKTFKFWVRLSSDYINVVSKALFTPDGEVSSKNKWAFIQDMKTVSKIVNLGINLLWVANSKTG